MYREHDIERQHHTESAHVASTPMSVTLRSMTAKPPGSAADPTMVLALSAETNND